MVTPGNERRPRPVPTRGPRQSPVERSVHDIQGSVLPGTNSRSMWSSIIAATFLTRRDHPQSLRWHPKAQCPFQLADGTLHGLTPKENGSNLVIVPQYMIEGGSLYIPVVRRRRRLYTYHGGKTGKTAFRTFNWRPPSRSHHRGGVCHRSRSDALLRSVWGYGFAGAGLAILLFTPLRRVVPVQPAAGCPVPRRSFTTPGQGVFREALDGWMLTMLLVSVGVMFAGVVPFYKIADGLPAWGGGAVWAGLSL